MASSQSGLHLLRRSGGALRRFMSLGRQKGVHAGSAHAPQASWSALAFGAPPDVRSNLDAAFPEFQKIFVSRTAPLPVVERHFLRTGRKVVLCWGPVAPRSLIELKNIYPDIQILHVYHGPFNLSNGRMYQSFSLDWTGLYVNPRRVCDFEYFGNAFPFDANPALVKAAGALRSDLVSAAGRDDGAVVVLLQDRTDPAFALAYTRGLTPIDIVRAAADEHPDAPIALAMTASPVNQARQLDEVREQLDARARARLTRPIDESEVVDQLMRCRACYTVSAPAAAAAVLAGRPVTTFGPGFYAGWGLTDDRRTVLRRNRSLDVDEFAALVFGLCFRWISDDGSILFPGLDGRESA